MFILNQEHKDFVNGKSDTLPGTPRWLLLILWGLPSLLLLIGLFFGSLTYRSVSEQNALSSSGKTTSGTFTNKTRTKGSTTEKRTTTWTYQFSVDGTTYEGIYKTNGMLALREDASYTEVGDTIDVTYLPDNPIQSRIVIDDGWPVGFTVTSLLFLLFAGVFGGAALKLTGGIGSAKSKPRLISAQLDDITPRVYNKEEDTKVVFSYSFRSPQTGKIINNSYTQYPPIPDPLPEIGRSIAAAYINDEENWLL